MAGLEAIRDAIKTTIEAGIPTLHCYDTVPEATNLPAVVVAPTAADFDVTMGRGTDTWTFTLAVLVQSLDADLGQDRLDALVTGAGATSIRQCIFNARSLGLANVDAHVSAMSGYGGTFESAGANHIGATLTLNVHTTGTA